MKDYIELINKEYSEIAKLKNYLNDTDYKLLRELDGGEKMDDNTKLNRANARKDINIHEANIKQLEEEWSIELSKQIENYRIIKN